jgi:hypothetical protein
MQGRNTVFDGTVALSADEQITRYMECVVEPDDIVEVRCIRTSGGKTEANRGWHLASSLALRVGPLAESNERGWNVYVGANPRPHKRATGDRCIQLARTLFADFDGGCSVDEARRRWEAAGMPQPSLVIQSGHGIHVYWRLSEPLTDLCVWSQVQRLLIAALRSDASIHNPERMMRLPGFLNVKCEPHVPCSILDKDRERRYEFGELSRLLQRQDTETNGQVEHDSSSAAADDESVMSRAREYIRQVPNERQGSRNGAAFRVSAVLVNDFGLGGANAFQLLREWNVGNDPPLDETELVRVLKSGGKYSKNPRGCKATPT